jgi:RNA polymerase sigma-70 factor (ECF subfamily)
MKTEKPNIDDIIHQYGQKIYKLCLFYLNDAEEAEDILQEILIKIIKKISSFRGESGLYTWIYRIAVNTLINTLNRKKLLEFISFETVQNLHQRREDKDRARPNPDPAVRLENEELEKQQLGLLEECLGRLSHREKAAFYFFYYDRLKQKEIAELMKTSVSAVESLVHKAMKKIKACVKNR